MPAVSNAHTIVIGPRTPTVERPKRPIADVQSPQAERRRRDTRPGLLTQSLSPSGPGHTHRRHRPSRVLSSPATTVVYTSTAPGHVQASLRLRKQRETRNERERIQHLHRSVRRDSDAQPPSLTPTASEIYARGSQFTASPTLRQSGGPDIDDVFALTSAQPHESIALSAQSSQYHSEAETDDFAHSLDHLRMCRLSWRKMGTTIARSESSV
ncbi:hypothetical protein E4U45_007274 [Claviceps purpurea]|nr:hypothetical protein E4U45_007274 [Claviceps purpurea]